MWWFCCSVLSQVQTTNPEVPITSSAGPPRRSLRKRTSPWGNGSTRICNETAGSNLRVCDEKGRALLLFFILPIVWEEQFAFQTTNSFNRTTAFYSQDFNLSIYFRYNNLFLKNENHFVRLWTPRWPRKTTQKIPEIVTIKKVAPMDATRWEVIVIWQWWGAQW